MNDIDKTKEQLIKELIELRERFTQCMVSETECGHLLKQLKESEERYRMVFESANDVIFLIDKNGKILEVNEKLTDLTGYTRENIIGKNIRKLAKLTTAKSLALTVKNFMKRMAGMHIPPYEIKLMRKDKTLVYAEINAVAIKKDGKIIGDLAVVRDITDRKLSEKSFKESETKTQAILNALPDLVYQISKDGVFLSYSGRKQDLYTTDETFLGKHVQDVLPPELAQQIMHSIKQTLKTGEIQVFEYELPTGDKIRQWEARMAVCGEDSVLTVVRDITERKQTLNALKNSEMRFRAIFETAEDSIFIKDCTQQYVQVNHAMEKLFGVPASELIGKTDEELFGKKAGAHIREVDTQVLKGKIIEEEQTKSVKEIPHSFHVIKVPLRDSSGKIIGLCGIARDITERHRTEKELRESEERYRATVELAPDGIIMVDQKGMVTSCNAVFMKLTGYSKDDIVGKYFSKMPTLRMRDIPQYIRVFRTLLRKKPVEPFEAEWRHKDGSQHWAEIHSSVIKRGTKTIGFQAIVRDITDRKKAEELLRESEEKYRAAVERSADNIYLLDVESKKILETNAALQKLLGYSSEELTKLTVYDIVAHPRNDINEKIKKILRVKRSFIGERRYRRKDGTIVDVEVSANYITLKGKKALYVVSRDITDRKYVEQALRESEEKYKTLTENINVGIYRNTVGPKGKFIEANPAIVKMFGYDSKYDFLAINVADLYQHPKDRARFNKKMLEQGFVHNEELQLMKKDGTPFIGSVSAVAVKDEHGEVKYYDGIIEDITDQKESEEALLESEQKFRGLYESVRDGIIMVDMDGNIVDCNNSFLNMLGYLQKEIMGLTYQGVTPIRYHKYEESIVSKQVLARGFSDEYEKQFIKKDGTKRSVTVTRWVVRNEQGNPVGMWSIVRDITERKRHEAELQHMATHDILTGLPNRMLFKDRLEQALKYAQRKGLQLAVMLLDLDQFKEINDSLGHNVGDKLLQHVGQRLSSVLRKGDTVARMGGDEFMLLLPEITQVSDSSTIAQKILIAIRTPIKIEQHKLHITTSIGIAVYPLDGLDTDTLMKNADIAMYWAKDKGRNDYQRYDQTMNVKKNTH
jgi:diguanylate cyclase (GGDEF)-like protein/PAS domain S-box-containing protein